ncbi:DUF4959 domain-containing protein [Puteibacter caeruleilacunae]|nr:DUF4959 domain-containing protein [Puteibacter caeruleilacunae]
MKRIKLSLFISFIVSLTYMACNDTELGPLVNDGIAPAPVTNVTFKAMPGGVELKYDLPADKDLLYVKAEYSIGEGRTLEEKSSKYVDTLVVAGFSEIKEYEVKLYAVDEGENVSEPTVIKVTPDAAPVNTIMEDLEFFADFGGVTVKWENPTEAEVAIIISAVDSLGEMKDMETFYSNKLVDKFTLRGQKNVPNEFSVRVRDKWENFSAVSTQELTPLLETKLDKGLFQFHKLLYDCQPDRWGQAVENMWNDIISNNNYSATDFPDKDPYCHMPNHFTIDLGDRYQLNRWRMNPLTNGAANPNLIELWGIDTDDIEAANTTVINTDENWEENMIEHGWIKLSHSDFRNNDPAVFHQERAKVRDIDVDDAPNKPAVRYVRVRVMETWAKHPYIWHMTELTFWGAPAAE